MRVCGWGILSRCQVNLSSKFRIIQLALSKVHLKLPFEMFLSDSKAQLRANGDSLPLASYFSFPKAGADSETTLLPPQKRLKDDTSYWGGFLQDMPVEDDTLSMFTHPRAIQKPRKRKIPRKTRRTPKNTLVLELVRDRAKVLRSQPAQTVGPKGLLYVQQREFAATTPKDGSVSILGSEDATTCHLVVLRHTGTSPLSVLSCPASGLTHK
ncbi:hypothetical protein JRQ81_010162 [Phrynocephalus forsythii]|uniref:Uncharacterized protein n=1 Tax=Phrynocephalus forsythii TaxID=171643 RepID=A0A9Q0X841_9SAUR|nr:hypothetical protein JRQ81_010162 [Phrynocephalus forsythii]